MPQQPVRRARLAWALLGLTVVLLVLSLVIAFTGGETFDTKFATIPVALAFAVVGALVAARTGNRIGWLFLAAPGWPLRPAWRRRPMRPGPRPLSSPARPGRAGSSRSSSGSWHRCSS